MSSLSAKTKIAVVRLEEQIKSLKEHVGRIGKLVTWALLAVAGGFAAAIWTIIDKGTK